MAQKNRNQEARAVLDRLHYREGEAFVLSEFVQIKAQVELEAEEQKIASIFELFRWKYVRRSATSMLLMSLTQFTGAGVIQAYQNLLYKSLSFEGKTLLLISGCYGVMGVIGQALCLWLLADRWPRVRTLGMFFLCLGNSFPNTRNLSRRLYRPGNRTLNPHGPLSNLRRRTKQSRRRCGNSVHLHILRILRPLL